MSETGAPIATWRRDAACRDAAFDKAMKLKLITGALAGNPRYDLFNLII
jgi:hypothetical protein